METGGGDNIETGSVTEGDGKQKSRTSISATLTPDFRNKEGLHDQ